MVASDPVAGSAKTIMAVDDDQSMIVFIGAIMRERGYNFVGARNGRECLEIIDDVRPDVLLLDINMPEMDGFETCRRLRAEHPNIAIPVLFLTGNDARESLADAIAAGGAEYLSKPIDSEVLSTRVEYWLSLI